MRGPQAGCVPVQPAIGITTRVEALPFAVYMPRAGKPEFTAALLGWGVSTGEGSYALTSLVATHNADKGLGPYNWSRYSNAKMDGLHEQALATMDNPRREKLLQEATEIAIREQAVVPLHYQVNTWAARRGYTYTPRTDERTYAHDVWHCGELNETLSQNGLPLIDIWE